MKITNDWQVSHGEDHTSEPPGNSETIESSEIIEPPEHQPPSSLKNALISVFILLSLGVVMSWADIQKSHQEAKRRREFIESLEMQPGDLELRDSGAEMVGGRLSVYLSIAGGPVGKSRGVEFSDYTLDYSLAVIVDEKKVHESRWKTRPTTAMFRGSTEFPHFLSLTEYLDNEASLQLSIKQGKRQILSTHVPLQEKTFNDLDFSQIKSRTADMGFFRFKNPARDSFFEGKSLAAEGKLDEAISAYTDALNLVPLYYDALMERGKARHTNKQYEEAKADFLEAVRISDAKPESCRRLAPFLSPGDIELLIEPTLDKIALVNFLNHVAYEYATCPTDSHRKADLALEYARRACWEAVEPSIENLKTLAAAHAENGDFEEAIRVTEEALAKTEARHLVNQLTTMLESFKEDKPIRRQQAKRFPFTKPIVSSGNVYRVGDQVEVEWAGSWHKASVLQILTNGRVKVHYIGWSDSWDEVVPLNRVRREKPAKN
ncbi:MAG: hypothetical protein ACON5J_18045 [Rubripirellula sp.]